MLTAVVPAGARADRRSSATCAHGRVIARSGSATVRATGASDYVVVGCLARPRRAVLLGRGDTIFVNVRAVHLSGTTVDFITGSSRRRDEEPPAESVYVRDLRTGRRNQSDGNRGNRQITAAGRESAPHALVDRGAPDRADGR